MALVRNRYAVNRRMMGVISDKLSGVAGQSSTPPPGSWRDFPVLCVHCRLQRGKRAPMQLSRDMEALLRANIDGDRYDVMSAAGEALSHSCPSMEPGPWGTGHQFSASRLACR